MKKKVAHRPSEFVRNVAFGFGLFSIVVATGAGVIPRRIMRNPTELRVGIDAYTPAGIRMPSRQEVLRFDVTAPPSSDALVQTFRFDFHATDNAGSNWNACDIAKFDLYDYTADNLSYTVEDQYSGVWQLSAMNNQTCRLTLRLAEPDIIPIGMSHEYRLYHDSVGASSIDDDSLQLSVLGVVAKSEAGRIMRLVGLPVTGGTILF